ncbi:M28 family peptidase [Flavobacterium sp.]|uniref:M28 family peptidase n=1 Tax=Flavobacterium sp. TaxID=239 RepID=UPI003D0EBA01
MIPKKIHLYLFLIFIVQAKAQVFIQRYADIVNQVSQQNVNSSLSEFENLGVKYRGTTALENTYQWLVNKYKSYGYLDTQIATDTYSYSGATCKNLIVTKVGTTFPNTYVIVCGHYDSIVGTGTNDNGSGVASILEMARLLKNINTEYSIKFINFSGEEEGLFGSQHYVSSVVNSTNPKMDIRIVFNLDEVGGVSGLTNDTITCERDENNSPSTNNALSNTFTNELITCVGLYSPLKAVLSYAYASDYMSFQSNNEVITGFFETNETTHKHTATDLLANMDPVYNYKVAKAAVGGLLHFAKADTSLSNSEFTEALPIHFYPNPTETILQINASEWGAKMYTVKIFDLNGKIVFEKHFESPKLIESIDVSNFSKGVYLIQMTIADKLLSKKIVLQ